LLDAKPSLSAWQCVTLPEEEEEEVVVVVVVVVPPNGGISLRIQAGRGC
jgi:hypothetical protein